MHQLGTTNRRITDPDLALAGRLHALANTLEQFPHLDGYRDCGCIRCRANTYAARGYPASTLGDGGSRASDTTSSTERAALAFPLFAELDVDYSTILEGLDRALADAEGVTATVLAHASDDDPIPAGTGPCILSKPPYLACDHLCNPRKNPTDRLRAGLCPACHQALLRYQRRSPGSTRQEFVAWRSRTLAEGRTQPKLQVVAENVG